MEDQGLSENDVSMGADYDDSRENNEIWKMTRNMMIKTDLIM